jgi:hypothetical protein
LQSRQGPQLPLSRQIIPQATVEKQFMAKLTVRAGLLAQQLLYISPFKINPVGLFPAACFPSKTHVPLHTVTEPVAPATGSCSL